MPLLAPLPRPWLRIGSVSQVTLWFQQHAEWGGSERRSAESLGPRMPRADLPLKQANL